MNVNKEYMNDLDSSGLRENTWVDAIYGANIRCGELCESDFFIV